MKICPLCGYALSVQEIESSRFEYLCPRCGKHDISEFCFPTESVSSKPDQHHTDAAHDEIR